MARQTNGHQPSTSGWQSRDVNTRTLGSELQRARKNKKLRQEDVAREVKCERQRVSDWERDIGQPDSKQQGVLARFLALGRGWLASLCVPDLPPLGRTPDVYCSHKPRYLPVGDRPPWMRMLSLFRTSRKIYDEVWRALNKRVDRAWVRRFFIKLQQDSKHESLGWMRLAAAGLSPFWLAPMRCGFRAHPVIDPESGNVVGDCRVPCLLREGDYPAVIFIQNTLLTRTGGPLRPDGLVGIRCNGEMRWCVTEFDGEGYDGCDNGRVIHLKMPVIRFSVAEIWEAGFAALYWRRVHKALGIPAAE